MTEREDPPPEEAFAELCARLRAEMRHLKQRFEEERRKLEARSFDPKKDD
jgi:hypothetical protein